MLESATLQAFRQSDPYEQLIAQMIDLERQPAYVLEDQRTLLETRKAVMSDINSKLSALDTLLDRFTDPLTSPFDGRAVNVDSGSGFTASVGDTAAFGSHSLFIERLASADTRVSDRLTTSGTSITGALGAGTKSFTLSVSSPTEADPNNRVNIAVSVDISGDDETVLNQISSAINAAMGTAVSDETIATDEKALASVVNETSSTVRLSLRAGQTGYAGRVDFAADPDGLLAQLGISTNGLADDVGGTGGMIKNVGTGETDSDLTSKFVLNGLTLYRNENQVTDALSDVTLTLKQTMDEAREFSVTPDSSGIKDEINDFIEKYNDVLSYIKTKSRVDGDSGFRGQLADDSAFTGLRFNMRTDVIRQVTGQPTGAPTSITEIGLELNNDGTLKLADEEALLAAVEQDADAVQALFGGDDGIATRLTERIHEFVRAGGLVRQRQEGLDSRIRTLNQRIDRIDENLVRREELLRSQFARLQESIAVFQGQQASLSALFG